MIWHNNQFYDDWPMSRADPSTQGNPGSVWNYRTYPPALNSTARLLQTVAELPGSRFQPCAPRAPFLPTSQARAAGMPATTTSFWPRLLRIAQFAGTEQSILHAPPYSLTSDQTCWFRECMTDYVAVSSPRVIKIRKIQALRA